MPLWQQFLEIGGKDRHIAIKKQWLLSSISSSPKDTSLVGSNEENQFKHQYKYKLNNSLNTW
jgi:hypothetical protein